MQSCVISAPTICPKDSVGMGDGCLAVMEDAEVDSFVRAEGYCHTFNGHLPSIHSEEENDIAALTR